MRKPCKIYNLAYSNPKLSKEWNYKKNYPLSPEDVTPYSNKKVWWKCNKDHEWKAIIHSRNHGSNCPYCAGKKVSRDNCLAILNPKLSKEWNYKKNYPLRPEDVTLYSNKKVWWKCKNGHSFESIINDRSQGCGCPYCSGHKVCKENCLAIKNPELAKEWHLTKNGKLTPNDVTCGCHKKVWWLCKNGHIWAANISTRNGQYTRCPYCVGKKVCKNNCLATINPKLAREWNYKKNNNLTPKDVVESSSRKAWWICKRAHEWEARVYSRSQGCGCPYCSGQKVCTDNCLATINPRLANEWNYKKNGGLTPEHVTCHNGKKVWWKCKNGHEWVSTIANRSQGRGCPTCGKVELKDGAICDSLTEAYYYLKLKEQKVNFKYHIKIGLGAYVCDFYIPSTNRYVEVTGYRKNSQNWINYYKNILRKKNHIVKRLKAKFKFVRTVLTSKQVQYVKENSI